MAFEENILRLTVTVRFQKKKCALCNREFSYSFFQSISYNNVVVTKQFFFSPIFLKSWIHISDNIAGVVGGPQDY